MSCAPEAVRIGTRGSPLALWQAERIRSLLETAHENLHIDLVVLKTRAENFPEKSLARIGVGVFTQELDDALMQGDIDLAVHSLKDLPSTLADGLCLAAVPERESWLDAWISRDGKRLADLERGAVIGTSSPRRQAQLRAAFPGKLHFVELRGNVDTRVRKMRDEGLAGTILAHAGLIRLGRTEVITELLPTREMLPAVSQGALGVVTRAEDPSTRRLVEQLDNADWRICAEAERGFLRTLRGGCQVPAGALARLDGESVHLEGLIASVEGAELVRGEADGPASAAAALGVRLGEQLLGEGGESILEPLRNPSP